MFLYTLTGVWLNKRCANVKYDLVVVVSVQLLGLMGVYIGRGKRKKSVKILYMDLTTMSYGGAKWPNQLFLLLVAL